VSGLLDRVRAFFATLAPRERVLVLAAGAMLLAFLLWFAAVLPVLGRLQRAERSIAEAERALASAARLRLALAEVDGRLAAVEQRIREGPSGDLFTTLEDLARQSSVQVESMEPQASPSHERFRETKLQVVLKAVTLAQAVNFLHRIETAPRLLSIKSLRLRTRPDASGLLDVTFTVSSFEST
jgi:type II secretory pathway component PulM